MIVDAVSAGLVMKALIVNSRRMYVPPISTNVNKSASVYRVTGTSVGATKAITPIRTTLVGASRFLVNQPASRELVNP